MKSTNLLNQPTDLMFTLCDNFWIIRRVRALYRGQLTRPVNTFCHFGPLNGHTEQFVQSTSSRFENKLANTTNPPHHDEFLEQNWVRRWRRIRILTNSVILVECFLSEDGMRLLDWLSDWIILNKPNMSIEYIKNIKLPKYLLIVNPA